MNDGEDHAAAGAFGPAVPILRIFDEQKAREFYVDFLGFKIDFEHRFSADAPLYIGASLSKCLIHLSEHHGDATPGARIRIQCGDVAHFAAVLAENVYKFARPGKPEATPWGTVELTIADPFGNRLTFWQAE